MSKISRLAAAVLLWAAIAASAGEPREVTVHCHSMTWEVFEDIAVQASLRSLRLALPGYRVEVVMETMPSMRQAYAEHPGDYFVVTGGFLWERINDGSSQVASITTPMAPHPGEGVAGVFAALKERGDIDGLESLRGKRAAVTKRDAFMNTLVPMGEIAMAGWDPDRFFSRVVETSDGFMRSCLLAVVSGEADVALVRAGLLESMKNAGDPLADGMKVINERDDGRIGYAHSTRAYPGWVMMAGPEADPMVTSDIAVALLSMTEKDAGGGRWITHTGLSSLDSLYRSLKIGPYAYLRQWTLGRLWNEYRAAVAGLALFIIFAAWHSWRSGVLVRRRTAELREAMRREAELAARAGEASERIARLQKTSLVGLFSSIVAHDLLQPLSASKYYLQAVEGLLARGRTEEAAPLVKKSLGTVNRGIEMVSRIRNYAKKPEGAEGVAGLRERFEAAAADMRQAKRLPVEPEISGGGGRVIADPFELDIVFMHLLENAEAAAAELPQGERSVRARFGEEEGMASFRLSNSGRPVAPEDVAGLLAPLRSTKRDGLGLGLPIAVEIVEKMGGTIRVEANGSREGGLTVSVSLPAAGPAEEGNGRRELPGEDS